MKDPLTEYVCVPVGPVKRGIDFLIEDIMASLSPELFEYYTVRDGT